MTPSELYDIGRRMMNEHGLGDWKFEVARSKRRFGCCKYGRKKILVSAPLAALNDSKHVINTILHEIAHALVGPNEGHGPRWVSMAKTIGCTGDRCYSSEVVQPPRRYKGTCPNGHVAYREHMPRAGRVVSCGKCSRRFNPEFAFKWSTN